MDKHTATEMAYKNGYAKGYADGTQKWIPVTERLPEKSGYCLVISKRGIQIVVHYSAKNKAFNSFDSLDDHDGDMHPTHWMPLPDAPKGE